MSERVQRREAGSEVVDSGVDEVAEAKANMAKRHADAWKRPKRVNELTNDEPQTPAAKRTAQAHGSPGTVGGANADDVVEEDEVGTDDSTKKAYDAMCAKNRDAWKTKKGDRK